MPDDTITPQGIDPVSLVVVTIALLGPASLLTTIAVLGHRGRLRSHHACGVRTKATLTDSAVWYRVHRLAAPWFGLAGALLFAAVPPFLLLPGWLARAVTVYVALAAALLLVITGGVRANAAPCASCTPTDLSRPERAPARSTGTGFFLSLNENVVVLWTTAHACSVPASGGCSRVTRRGRLRRNSRAAPAGAMSRGKRMRR